MKTTIDLADDLVATLREKTAHEGISMRAAVHQALRHWLKSQPDVSPRKRIPRHVGIMQGHGMTPAASSLSWEELRAIGYDQHP